MRKRYLSLASLLLALVLPVTALAQSGSNGNYYQFNTRSDGQIGTPPTGKIRFFWNGSSLRYKLPNGSFVNVGGGGSSFDKLTQSGTNNGTLTLYDDTAVTGVSNFAIRDGAGQSTADAITFYDSAGTNTVGLRRGADNYIYVTKGAGGGDFGRIAAEFFQVGSTVTGFLNQGNTIRTYVQSNSYVDFTTTAITPVTDNNYALGSATTRFTSLALSGGLLYGDGAVADTGLARASAGVLKVTDGSSGNGSLAVYGNINLSTGGEYIRSVAGNRIGFGTNSAEWVQAFNGGLDIYETGQLWFSTLGGTSTVGLTKASAGVLKVTDGSSGSGSLDVGNITPNADATYNIGDSTHYIKDLYLLNSLYKLVATAAAGSPTVDLATGAIQEVTLSDIDGAHTITWSNIKAGAVYTITILQDATDGGETVTWDSHTKWAAGTAPTLTSATGSRDIFTFYSDGTNLYETGRTLDVR